MGETLQNSMPATKSVSLATFERVEDQSQQQLFMDSDDLGNDNWMYSDYDRPYRDYQDRRPNFYDYGKRYGKILLKNKSFFTGNLAALDCFATIHGVNPYQKTYQDNLDVPYLVNDFDDKPFNIDKLFREASSTSEIKDQPSLFVNKRAP